MYILSAIFKTNINISINHYINYHQYYKRLNSFKFHEPFSCGSMNFEENLLAASGLVPRKCGQSLPGQTTTKKNHCFHDVFLDSLSW